mgnify:CR=1 FL=1
MSEVFCDIGVGGAAVYGRGVWRGFGDGVVLGIKGPRSKVFYLFCDIGCGGVDVLWRGV